MGGGAICPSPNASSEEDKYFGFLEGKTLFDQTLVLKSDVSAAASGFLKLPVKERRFLLVKVLVKRRVD